jgi:hypothetical protein
VISDISSNVLNKLRGWVWSRMNCETHAKYFGYSNSNLEIGWVATLRKHGSDWAILEIFDPNINDTCEFKGNSVENLFHKIHRTRS